MGRVHYHSELSLLMPTLTVILLSLLECKDILSYHILSEKLTMCRPCLNGGELYSTLKTEDSQDTRRILLHWRAIFCPSVYYSWSQGYLSHPLGHNPRSLDLLCCSVFSNMATKNFFTWYLCPLKYLIVVVWFPHSSPLPRSSCLLYSMTRINHSSNDLSPWSAFIHKWSLKNRI